MKKCTVKDCFSKHEARGFCQKHYARWKKYNDPLQACPPKRSCRVTECHSDSYSKGYCEPHYRRQRLYGDPLGQPSKISDEERFWRRVDKTTSDENCWLWLGRLHNKGYGEFDSDGKAYKAHRYAYSVSKTKPLTDMQIDHVCHNRSCVNPKHLREVTNAQNSQNRSKSSSYSSSGYRNVYEQAEGKFVVRVGKDGVEHYGGIFEQAYHAHLRAESMRAIMFTHNSKW